MDRDFDQYKKQRGETVHPPGLEKIESFLIKDTVAELNKRVEEELGIR